MQEAQTTFAWKVPSQHALHLHFSCVILQCRNLPCLRMYKEGIRCVTLQQQPAIKFRAHRNIVIFGADMNLDGRVDSGWLRQQLSIPSVTCRRILLDIEMQSRGGTWQQYSVVQ